MGKVKVAGGGFIYWKAELWLSACSQNDLLPDYGDLWQAHSEGESQ